MLFYLNKKLAKIRFFFQPDKINNCYRITIQRYDFFCIFARLIEVES